MRKLTITLSILLLGPGAVRTDEPRAWTRNAVADRFSLVSIQPVVRAIEFPATLRKIDGDKITLVRHVLGTDEKEETLIAAADCKLFEPRLDKETRSIERFPVEGGLKGDIDPQQFVSAEIRVNRENQIIEIRAYGDRRAAASHRFHATIKKVEGDKISVLRTVGLEGTLTATPACKVFEVRFAKEGLPLVTDAVAGGLAAEVFTKESPRVLMATDKEGNVVEVCILRPNPHLFEATIKKIDGDKLTLVKRRHGKGEETISAAALCEVFEEKLDKGSGRSEKLAFERGLKSEFLTMKRVELRFHTDKEHKVTRINVLYNPCWYEAVVRMDKLDSVRIFKEKKDLHLDLAPECRILQARVDRDTARPTYSLVKGGIKEAVVPKRPFSARIMYDDADRVIELRIHKDPANFAAHVSKVENKAGETILSIHEPALSKPGSEARGAYHTQLTASKDCRVFKRKSAGGKSTLERVEGPNPWASLSPRMKGAKGGTQFVVARILLAEDGKVTEVQILEGVTSVEKVK